ncbi:ankyrin repeat and LEM domain-containing protein 1 isoform X2 [Pteropus medius]|uniref:ankyrin repeat and LEM domain-containing protein 1 isoform X2 n=1 Tax=Pteropus vampyrus TaxID=132908 RepID=UPI00196AD159|nr:ankyrin repeat and LEM domain-containing protein 1 isoform X2 [Pteropus giganteus]
MWRPEPSSVAARAHRGAAENLKLADGTAGLGDRASMGAVTGLEWRLRAALREEEPRVVEELLRRGADPNLVLPDGAAAMHLAAGAQHPGALRCLKVLMRRGGDPNARSAEGLTPLHVAAGWGCLRGMELLLSQGADPALRDQDGLRPLDLAEQQGHQDCAHVLRELQMLTRTPTRTRAETEELEPESGDDQGSLERDVAALWLTEDEESSTGGKDPFPSCWCLPDPTTSDLELPQGLRTLGKSPGPITPSARPYHLRRLEESQAVPGPDFAGHSPELSEALRTGRIPDAQADEDALARQFERPDPGRRWREGVVKSSFTYLLLDPRETQDLPARAFSLTLAECLRTFVHAIFYVGKGTRARPNVHLWEALDYHGRPGKQACPKVRQILDIWASGHGVVSLHCFQHVIAVEAYTREACLVDALGIRTLTNQKQGHCYGVVASWPPARRRRLGVHLLHRALLVFLAEGERELRPQDIQARS